VKSLQVMQQGLLDQGAFLHAMRGGIPFDLFLGFLRDMSGNLRIAMRNGLLSTKM
jgi:hypothetical protein